VDMALLLYEYLYLYLPSCTVAAECSSTADVLSHDRPKSPKSNGGRATDVKPQLHHHLDVMQCSAEIGGRGGAEC
jgi:hypothetical protein